MRQAQHLWSRYRVRHWLTGLVGPVPYRHWKVNLSAEAGKWYVHPDDVSFRRQELEIAAHWAF
ncbi:MAG: hypothetical protein OYH76_24710 [Defluviicoccus sp.]|nr:hypothetical protein [Defluviicoccus sp.]MDE0279110.1 hypothetical protein [Defluviicoccus sp.]